VNSGLPINKALAFINPFAEKTKMVMRIAATRVAVRSPARATTMFSARNQQQHQLASISSISALMSAMLDHRRLGETGLLGRLLHSEAAHVPTSAPSIPKATQTIQTPLASNSSQQQQQKMMDDLKTLMKEGKASVRFFQLLFWGADGENTTEEHPKLRAWIRQHVHRGELIELLLRMADSLETEGMTIGASSSSLGNVLFSRANLYFVLDDLAHAKDNYSKSFEALQLVHGSTAHPDIACTLGSLASIHFQERDYETALRMYRQASEIEIKFFGDSHLQVAQTLHNIAMTYLELNDLSSARKSISRAIEIKRAHYPEGRHPDLALSLSGLGDILKAEGKLDLAKLAYEETIQIFESVYGRNHFEIPHNLMEIAEIFRHRGDAEEAQKLLSRAMEIHRHTFGENDASPQLARLLEMTGDVHKELDHPTEAVGSYEECLQVLLKLSPDSARDPSVARIKFNLAVLGMESQPIEETVAELRDAASIYRKAFGSNDLNFALALHTLGAALVRQGRPNDAMQAFDEALVIRKTVLGQVNEQVADSLTDIGYVLLVQERYADAEKRFRSAVDVYYKALPADQVEDNPKLALAHYHLANACYMLNKQLDAEKNFVQALAISRTALGDDHPQVKSLEAMVKKLLPNRRLY